METSALEAAPKTRWKPNRKPTVGLVAGSLTAVLVWAAAEFWQVQVPSHIAAELATIVSFVLAYWIAEPV